MHGSDPSEGAYGRTTATHIAASWSNLCGKADGGASFSLWSANPDESTSICTGNLWQKHAALDHKHGPKSRVLYLTSIIHVYARYLAWTDP